MKILQLTRSKSYHLQLTVWRYGSHIHFVNGATVVWGVMSKPECNRWIIMVLFNNGLPIIWVILGEIISILKGHAWLDFLIYQCAFCDPRPLYWLLLDSHKGRRSDLVISRSCVNATKRLANFLDPRLFMVRHWCIIFLLNFLPETWKHLLRLIG